MKEVKIAFFAIILISLIGIISAETCNIRVSMINQDPYPAIPGEPVKVVFQIEGISNPNCGLVNFQVKEEFPFSVDPSSTNPIEIRSGTYSRKYSSFYIAPYKLRVNENALDGNNPLEIAYTFGNSQTEILKDFNVYIKNSKADFEIYVKNYDIKTNSLVLEILNIEDVDIKALTLEIPKQENIQVRGANRKVIGDLDSNEYTTAEFEAVPKDGEIEIKIIYTDMINIRREITKKITFDKEYFNESNKNKKNNPYWLYIIIGIVVVFIIFRKIRKSKIKKKKLEQQKHHQETHKH